MKQHTNMGIYRKRKRERKKERKKKTPGLYLVPIKSYCENTQGHSFFGHTIIEGEDKNTDP
jgi:hypothetical protein